MANGPVDPPEPVPGDLDPQVGWVEVTALAEEYDVRLAFNADDWGAASGWRGRSGRALLDLTFAEISGVGYPWVDLRDGDLVGLLEKDGPAWPSLLDPVLEQFGPGSGTWSTTLLDGTVVTYEEWLAEHPEAH